ncbi:RHS repeat-associated core domain-containing protein [Stenotrophomonas sp. SbOxS2]|uniref:RHS repeat-associated core domain-containing protein n=1 Tax=Stenotrophomonas sp. SbOxS2 TaxID=2723885 RepID=UPI00211DDEFC|nr:RHS repeat-associated core domain-containing protein [Stenotrophomonas sp. SbOxS2]
MLSVILRTLLALTLVACSSAASAQTVTYIHTDALGSVVAESDANGAVIKRHIYEPYGAVVGGQVADGPGYTGHVSDSATGLSYMQQRYMDPELGVFLSVDPVTAYENPIGMFNRYRYASGNPYRYTDPDGRCDTSFCQFWGGVGRAIGDSVYSVGRNAGPSVYGTIDMSRTRELNGGPLFGAPAGQVGQGGYKFGSALMVAEGMRGTGQAAGGLATTEARLVNNSLVVRGGSGQGANSVAGIAKGTGPHPAGPFGFSAESANGASFCQLCSNITHNQVGVTTVGQVRAAGGDVISTRGVSPTHATVVGLEPEAASRLFSPSVSNPVPVVERLQRP